MTPPTADAVSPPLSRHVVLYSLLAGFCPLIPIPFLDDGVRDAFRKRLATGLAGDYGVELDGRALKLLALGIPPSLLKRGVGGCIHTVFVKPVTNILFKLVKKIFRKIVIVLLIKDCVDAFSHTFHEGHLIHHALYRGDLDGSEPAAMEVRRAIDAAAAAIDTRPLEQILRRTGRSGWRLAVSGWRELGRYYRLVRRRGDEEAMLRSPLVEQLREILSHEGGYLQRLETLYEQNLREVTS